MKTSKFFVPALLAVTLMGGTAFATNAISAPHGGGHGGNGTMGSSDGNMGSGEGHMGGMGGGMGGMGGCAGMSDSGKGYHNGGMGYHNGGMGYHMGQVYNDLSPEKRAQFDTMVKEFRTKTEATRDTLYVKHQEMRALQNAANPDVNAVSKTASEITALRKQMRTEHDNFMTKLQNDLGIKDIYGTDNKAPKAAPKK